MVEQFRVARGQTGEPEVVGGGHQPGAEVVLPHPVGEDAGGERMAWVGDPFGQLHPTPCGGRIGRPLRGGWRRSAEDRREGRRHLGPGSADIPAQEDAGRPGLGSVLGDGQGEVEGRGLRFGPLQFGLGSLPCPGVCGPGEPLSQIGEAPVMTGAPVRPFRFGRQRPGDLAGASPASAGVLLAVTVDVPQEAQQRVVVGLRERVELVVVAARASDGQPEEGHAGGAEHVVEVVELRGGGVVGLVVPGVQPVEPRGDEAGPPLRSQRRCGADRGLGQLVARDLFAHEPVVGLVGVEAVDDVVAVAPGVGLRPIPLVAVALGIADQVQPMATPALAVLRRFEQPIDEPGPGGVGGVALELRDDLGRGRQTQKVEMRPAHLFARCGRRVGFQAFLPSPRLQQVIDRMGARGRRRPVDRLEGPVGAVGLGDGERARPEGRPLVGRRQGADGDGSAQDQEAGEQHGGDSAHRGMNVEGISGPSGGVEHGGVGGLRSGDGRGEWFGATGTDHHGSR